MSSQVFCISHPNAYLVSDWAAGDVICTDCGLVVQDRVIDVSSEWRTFSDDNHLSVDKSRVGSIENKNIETAIEKKANSIFLDYISRLNLDQSVKNLAQGVFHKIIKADLNKGYKNEKIVAVCIYIACRQSNSPRTFKEIAAASESSEISIQKCYIALVKGLKKIDSSFHVPLASFNEHIIKFCTKLKLNIKVEQLSKKILDECNGVARLRSKKPQSLVAASIYIATDLIGLNKAINEISQVTCVAASTIKSTCKIIKNNFDVNKIHDCNKLQ